MANKNEYCKGCLYNIPKTKGGYGRICNGLTMKKYNRCPEWRIEEARKERKTSDPDIYYSDHKRYVSK